MKLEWKIHMEMDGSTVGYRAYLLLTAFNSLTSRMASFIRVYTFLVSFYTHKKWNPFELTNEISTNKALNLFVCELIDFRSECVYDCRGLIHCINLTSRQTLR